ncbi:hypothetical protein PSQ19_05410 [Devosia algicola]|uniref:AprE-like long alpha-helical hairpin domain-containing protein n=1 Tax=Devosia algicola TaxID=3026418 RepID=A0ABY7YQD0_9HYPH|nr:hypothetical protein [Devosia algicola]WDR03530.1 hypothetical protein PSQ19_05410 [Devosia algicola]
MIKALSLAGGDKLSSGDGGRPERELLTTAGTLEVFKDEHLRLLVRRARLDAELAGAKSITLPPQLTDKETIQPLLAAEEAILLARQRQMVAQTVSLDEEVTVLTQEINTFEQKRTATERQLEQARDQLAKITQLSDNGLALSSRVSSLQTNVSDLEGRLLDIDTSRLQARKDIGGA